MLIRVIETRINWFAVFDQLKRLGWSLHSIEQRLHVPKSTLIGWKLGAEPRHSEGELLINLWQSVTQQSRGTIPTEKRYPNAHNRR